MEEHEMQIITVVQHNEFKGVSVDYDAEYCYCDRADETYADEYKKILVQGIGNPALPVLFNVNIGHATPRCIIPFGVPARVDAMKQTITFDWKGTE